jgi:hypothetical protein
VERKVLDAMLFVHFDPLISKEQTVNDEMIRNGEERKRASGRFIGSIFLLVENSQTSCKKKFNKLSTAFLHVWIHHHFLFNRNFDQFFLRFRP